MSFPDLVWPDTPDTTSTSDEIESISQPNRFVSLIEDGLDLAAKLAEVCGRTINNVPCSLVLVANYLCNSRISHWYVGQG